MKKMEEKREEEREQKKEQEREEKRRQSQRQLTKFAPLYAIHPRGHQFYQISIRTTIRSRNSPADLVNPPEI